MARMRKPRPKEFLVKEDIVFTKDLIKAMRKLRPELRNMDEFSIRKKLKHEVKNSNLVAMSKTTETRNYYGHLYEVKRDGFKLFVINGFNSKNVQKIHGHQYKKTV